MKKKLISFGLIFVVIIGIIGFFTVYLPYRRIRAKGEIVVASAKELKADFKKNNIDLIQNRLSDISKKYADFEKESKSVYWLSFIPYVHDFKSGVEAGDYMIKAGQDSIKAIYPY